MKYILWAAGIAALLFAVYASWSAFGPVHVVAIGQRIQHDDFFFTVQHVTAVPGPAGTRYTVSILVENQAKRVPYTWRDGITVIRDADGKTYAPVSSGTFTLDAGESRTARVAFLLPANVRGPALRFWDGIFMGDALNGVRYAHEEVALQ